MTPYCTSRYGAIYHGNSARIIDAVLRDHPARRHILLTDPMYGQKANSNTKSSKRGGSNTGKLKGVDTTEHHTKDWNFNDDAPFDPGMWIDLSFDQYILFGAQNYASKLPDSKKWIVWDKRGTVVSDDNADAEMAWTLNVPGPTRIYTHLWKGLCRAGEENISIQGPKLHTFQKPVALMQFCLKELAIDAPEHSLVIDPYSGSCSTGVACERLGIPWIGIEILEEYCEIGKQRIMKEMAAPHLFGYADLWSMLR